MPNWAYSNIKITGPADHMEQIKNKLATPYENEGVHEGDILLWNIVSPTDLDAYNNSTITGGSTLEEIQREFDTKDDWYSWNVRNWGTKWEIHNGSLISEYSRTKGFITLEYSTETAWSPPVEAFDWLAMENPDLIIDLEGIDEADCFAMTAVWINGIRKYESDLEITHELRIRLMGYCWLVNPTLRTMRSAQMSRGKHRQPQNVLSYSLRAIGVVIRALLTLQTRLVLLQGRRLNRK